MPNWQPNWQNVRWDQSAASHAATALRAAADELERSAREREAAAEQARAEWRGMHRMRFDAHIIETLSRARALAAQYRDAAARIMQASTRAHDEQAQRMRDRERWQREKEQEERERRQREEFHRRR